MANEPDTVSLRDFFTREIAGLKEYFDIKIDSMDKALVVAQREMERRLEGMNEFRAQLDRQNSEFITRQQFESKHEAIQEQFESKHEANKKDIQDLKLTGALLEGKASQKSLNFVMFVSVASLIIGAISIILRVAK